MRIGLGLAVCLCCGGEVRSGAKDASPTATTTDAKGQTCDIGSFAAPQLVPILSTKGSEGPARVSADDLTLYYNGWYDDITASDIFVSHRKSTLEPFTNPVKLALNSAKNEYDPMVTSNGLELFFGINNGPTTHLYRATRSSTQEEFANPSPISELNSGGSDAELYFIDDGAEVWFASSRAGNQDIFHTSKVGGSYQAPVAVSELNTTFNEWAPVVTADGLVIYFASERTGGGTRGANDIWAACRTTRAEPFGKPVNVVALNTPQNDFPGSLSPDQRRFYLTSDRPGLGANDIYVVERH